VLLAVAVNVVALASLHGMPRLDHDRMDPLPVRGAVLPTGHFVGTLRIVAGTIDAAGELRLTGLLSGTATRRTGATIAVIEQPFTAAASLHDAGYTTDVVNLALAPIALDPAGVRIRLAPITVDIEALPDMSDELETLWPMLWGDADADPRHL
jgi:hypothetical protein